MKKILVVIDMQNDFIDGALGTKEAQLIVEPVVDEIKKKKEEGYLVYATQDTHFDDYLDTLEGKKLPVKHCIKGTQGWEIRPEILAELDKDKIIEKKTFGSEKLVEILKQNPPEEIELLGLCTDICVASNALLLRAAFPNTPISVKEECTAGVTPELAESALQTLGSCQVDLI